MCLQVIWVYTTEDSLPAIRRASNSYARKEKDLAWLRLYFEEVMAAKVVAVVVVVLMMRVMHMLQEK